MFIPESFVIASLFLAGTMLLWGSWPNFLKLAKGARFEIFYIDFVLGLLFMSLFIGISLGSWGAYGESFLSSLFESQFRYVLRAFLSGMIFNVAFMLLVAAAAYSAISYAFMTCFGFAIIIDSFFLFLASHFEKPTLYVIGIILMFLATFANTAAQKKIPGRMHLAKKTLQLSLTAGFLIGLFYPLLQTTLDESHMQGLTPYGASFFFSSGILACTLIIQPLFMRKPLVGHPISIHIYPLTSFKVHLFGFLAGMTWSLGLSLKLLSIHLTGLNWAFTTSQGATLITYLWGIFLWKEIPLEKGFRRYAFLSLFFYLAGLLAIGISRNITT